jgi:hypothetical protein
MILLISASSVARITGVSHWHPVWLMIYFPVYRLHGITGVVRASKSLTNSIAQFPHFKGEELHVF